MVSDSSVEMWKEVQGSEEEQWYFPKYFVSQPPHRDTLTPVYYKVVSPDGPVFWRREDDDTGRETTFYDLLMEERCGFGINNVDKEYTPWADG
jgi:hypothetical protein